MIETGQSLIRRLIALSVSAAVSVTLSAQTPELRHVFDIHALIDKAVEGEITDKGKSVTIPITGGEIKGEVNGVILSGGADYQSVDTVNQRVLLRAVYEVMTPDSVIIKVVNEGINLYKEGNYYFMTAPRFECNRESPYAWLNDRLFLCRPIGFESDGIVLRVWEAR